jgi:hypothetical protein
MKAQVFAIGLDNIVSEKPFSERMGNDSLFDTENDEKLAIRWLYDYAKKPNIDESLGFVLFLNGKEINEYRFKDGFKKRPK